MAALAKPINTKFIGCKLALCRTWYGYCSDRLPAIR